MNALWNHHFSHHVNIFLWEKLKLNSKRNQKRKSPPWVDQPLLVPLQISLTTCYLISHQGRRKLWNLQCNLPKTKSVPGLDLTKYIPASCLACNLFSQFRQVHSYRIPSECLFSITPVQPGYPTRETLGLPEPPTQALQVSLPTWFAYLICSQPESTLPLLLEFLLSPNDQASFSHWQELFPLRCFTTNLRMRWVLTDPSPVQK